MIEFAKKNNELIKINEKILSLKRESLLKNSIENLEKIIRGKESENTLTIAVCGQYSAGKSTIISALTGIKDIEIGQDITTNEVKTYKWNDVLIADTPGIKAGREDHDRLSNEYINQADLLLYVITIQGFDRIIGDNFKSLIYDKKYLEKTMLVMNKRNKESASNEVAWRNDIDVFFDQNKQVSKELHFSIIDAEDYLNGQNDNDKEFIEISNFNEFINNLNLFVKEKGLIGKVLSKANIFDDFLTIEIEKLSVCQEDERIENKTLSIIDKTMTNCNKIYIDNSRIMKQEVRKLGNDYLDLFTETTMEEFKSKGETIEGDMNRILECKRLQCDLEAIHSELVSELGDLQSTIHENEVKLNNRINLRSGAFDNTDLTNMKKGVIAIGKFAGSITKEGFTKFVHFLGVRLKPWGATKWISRFGKIAKMAPWIAVMTDVISFFKDKKHEEEMHSARREIKNSFKEIEEGIDKQLNELKISEYSIVTKLQIQKDEILKSKQRKIKEAELKNKIKNELQEIKNELSIIIKNINK